MDIVRWSRSGVKDNIGVSSVEVSLELFGDRFHVHLLYSPNLQARCFTCTLELLVENHDSWKMPAQECWDWTIFLKIKTIKKLLWGWSNKCTVHLIKENTGIARVLIIYSFQTKVIIHILYKKITVHIHFIQNVCFI